MVEILGSIPEQKCKLCLRKGCTNPECVNLFLRKHHWSKKDVEFTFFDFIKDEIFDLQRLERKNKIGSRKFPVSNKFQYRITEPEMITIYDPDLFNLDALFRSYYFAELFIKYKLGLLTKIGV